MNHQFKVGYEVIYLPVLTVFKILKITTFEDSSIVLDLDFNMYYQPTIKALPEEVVPYNETSKLLYL